MFLINIVVLLSRPRIIFGGDIAVIFGNGIEPSFSEEDEEVEFRIE